MQRNKEPRNWDEFDASLKKGKGNVEVDFKSVLKKGSRPVQSSDAGSADEESVPEWAKKGLKKTGGFDHLEKKTPRSDDEEQPAWASIGLKKASTRSPEDAPSSDKEEEVPEFLKKGLKKTAVDIDAIEKNKKSTGEDPAVDFRAKLKKRSGGPPEPGSTSPREEEVPEWAKKLKPRNIDESQFSPRGDKSGDEQPPEWALKAKKVDLAKLEQVEQRSADSSETDFRSQLKKGGGAPGAPKKAPVSLDSIKKELSILKSKWVTESKAREKAEANVAEAEKILAGLREHIASSKAHSDQILERIEQLTALVEKVQPAAATKTKRVDEWELAGLRKRLSEIEQQTNDTNKQYKSLKREYRKKSSAKG